MEELTRNESDLLKLFAREPASTLVRDHLYRTYGLRAVFHAEGHETAAALADQRRAVEFAPTEPLRLERRLFLALDCARAGQYPEALRLVEELIPRVAAENSPEKWTHLTAVCGLSARAAAADRSAREPDQAAGRRRAIDLAYQCLQGLKASLPAAEWSRRKPGLLFAEEMIPLKADPRWKPLMNPEK
jgi:hypothetical protein